MDGQPSERLASRASRVLGWWPQSWRRVSGGYTPTARWVVRGDGVSAFVKAAVDPLTAGMLRREIAAYRVIDGSFVPKVLGCEDDETEPLLIIEDLSGATWPPPWSPEQVHQVLAALQALRSSAAQLPSYETVHGGRAPGWAAVAVEPAPFLSLGVAGPRWLDQSLPALLVAEAACDPGGDAPTHWDVRSDNLCFTREGVKLIDWPEACLSNPKMDIGCWLPSLAFEGGPEPETILPRAPEIAAWVCGYFAARAGLPIIPTAPKVRRVQREQLSIALPWAARALGLDAP